MITFSLSIPQYASDKFLEENLMGKEIYSSVESFHAHLPRFKRKARTPCALGAGFLTLNHIINDVQINSNGIIAFFLGNIAIIEIFCS